MNRKKLFSIAKVLLFLGLGILLLWLLYRQFGEEEKKQFVEALQKAEYGWAILAIGINTVAHWSRAVRWRMLMQPLGHNPKVSNTFFAVMIGYMANYAVPRLGEITRCTLLNRYEKVPFAESFGTVIVERIFDFFSLLLVFIGTIVFQFTELKKAISEYITEPASRKFGPLMENTTFVVVAAIIFIGGIVSWWMLRKRIYKMLGPKFANIIKGFTDGMKAVRRIEKPWLFAFHSIFIWACYWLALYVVFYSFGGTSHLGLNAALVLLLFGTFGVIFTPGGIGAYQALVMGILLSVYGISKDIGFAFAWVTWGSQLGCVLIFGIISLILLPALNRAKI